MSALEMHVLQGYPLIYLIPIIRFLYFNLDANFYPIWVIGYFFLFFLPAFLFLSLSSFSNNH